jgi:hypothetical protein
MEELELDLEEEVEEEAGVERKEEVVDGELEESTEEVDGELGEEVWNEMIDPVMLNKF